MKYNCLRINQHVKMFFVGLLLYLGETVFFKCSEEETFTVQVKFITGLVIDVPNCQKTDMLSEFMKKFESAYSKEYNDIDFAARPYNLIKSGKPIAKASKPIEDSTLGELGFDAKNFLVHFVFTMLSGEREKLSTEETTEIFSKQITELEKSKLYYSFRDKLLENPLNNKIIDGYESDDDKAKKRIVEKISSTKKSTSLHKTKKKKGPSTSTCPLRRCCKICGC